MKKRPIQKGHTFSVRMPEKTRYGIDLLARKYRTQVSAIVTKAVDALLAAEGITAREDGELWSLLDKVWSDSPSMRLLLLAHNAPELATDDEKRVVESIQGLVRRRYAFLSKQTIKDALLSETDRTFAEVLVTLSSAYLGITSDPQTPKGDEEKYLRQCDEVVMSSFPEIAKECGGSVDTFRKKYITKPE